MSNTSPSKPPSKGLFPIPQPLAPLGWAWTLALSVVFLVPRLYRMSYHKIWIEDPYYLYTPYLMSLGAVPYNDFSAPYITFLDEIFSYVIQVFGPTARTFEFATVGLHFAISWCLFTLGKRMGGFRVGVLAGVFYALNYLVFRYHVHHREVYTTVFAVLGYVALHRWGREVTWRRVVLLGVWMSVGALMKQSIAVHAVPMFLYILIFRGMLWKSLAFGVLFNGLFALYSYIFYLRYGFRFLINTSYFHFVKGSTPAPRLLGTIQELNIWLLLGIVGLGWAMWSMLAVDQTFRADLHLRALPGKLRALAEPFWMVFAWDVIFNMAFNYVSLTFWPHYLLSLLPACMLGSAYLVDRWWSAIQHLSQAGMAALSTEKKALLPMVPVLAGLYVVAPFHPMLPYPERLGFGGESRREVARVVDCVQEHCPPEGYVICPPYIGLESQRRKLINFKDNLGNMMLLERYYKENRLEDARKLFRDNTFAQVRGLTTQEWMPWAREQIQSGKVYVVIPDFEFPIEPEFLIAAGFEIGCRTRNYTIWTKRRGS